LSNNVYKEPIPANQEMKGFIFHMNILITAGGTTEKIDTVRKITNSATGRLGCFMANEFSLQGGEKIEKIYYICEYSTIVPTLSCVEPIYFQGTTELEETLKHLLSSVKIDAAVHSMAVSDYSVKSLTTTTKLASHIAVRLTNDYNGKLDNTSLANSILDYIEELENNINNSKKICSDICGLLLMLKQTPKMINLFKTIQPKMVLVGFKLLSGVERNILINTAYELLNKNNCDFVLANDLTSIYENEHKGFLVSPNKSFMILDGKEQIAKTIVTEVLKKLYESDSIL
jgi:phosphopantothenate--cysteine ligase